MQLSSNTAARLRRLKTGACGREFGYRELERREVGPKECASCTPATTRASGESGCWELIDQYLERRRAA
jgi:hypothetical protein